VPAVWAEAVDGVPALVVVSDGVDDDGHAGCSGRHPEHRKLEEVKLRGLPGQALAPGDELAVRALSALEGGFSRRQRGPAATWGARWLGAQAAGRLKG
jgi:hypothetical protein